MGSGEEDERGFLAERPLLDVVPEPRSRGRPYREKQIQEKPHHLGHRQRLRDRFREAGPGALSD